MSFVSPVCVFLLSRNSLERFWEQVLWHLWICKARKPGPGQQHAGVEVFNVGRWLAHRDFALEAQVVVVERRSIPASAE